MHLKLNRWVWWTTPLGSACTKSTTMPSRPERDSACNIQKHRKPNSTMVTRTQRCCAVAIVDFLNEVRTWSTTTSCGTGAEVR